MPPRAQDPTGDFAYHVLNRAAKRSVLFTCTTDYQAFERVLFEAARRTGMRILAYCVMPNHWHFVLWPSSTKQLSQFMHWLTLTHAHRWQKFNKTVGTGAVYQARYKALPIQTDAHFLNVCRYVERNPLRAGLVQVAQDWQWSSLWRRQHGLTEWLAPWPVLTSGDWTAIVNGVEPDEDLARVRDAIRRGAPLGDSNWTVATAARLGLESTLRPRGRPKKDPDLFSSRNGV
jgi:putative transposase